METRINRQILKDLKKDLKDELNKVAAKYGLNATMGGFRFSSLNARVRVEFEPVSANRGSVDNLLIRSGGARSGTRVEYVKPNGTKIFFTVLKANRTRYVCSGDDGREYSVPFKAVTAVKE